MAVSRLVVCALVGLLACGPPARPAVAWPDAPVALRDDTDRDHAIDALWAMPPGAARDRHRGQIASALAQRIADAVIEDRPFDAAALLARLTALWQHDPAGVGVGLAPHRDLVLRLRAMFAKAGSLEAATLALVVLAEAEPARRSEHLAELDEVLAFANELAVSDNGAYAVRSQPIALLRPAATALPLRWLIDRYVRLMAERQRVISALIDKEGASMQLVRAHHDVLATSRRIAGALAIAGRIDELHAHLASLRGLGADRRITAHAEIVAEHPSAEAYLELARVLRDAPGEADSRGSDRSDPAAALGACLTGLARFPADVGLLVAAGGDAVTLGRTEQAIALYEQAVRTAEEVNVMVALRLGKLYGDRIARLAEAGRPTAARTAWHDVLTFTGREARVHPHSVWQQTTAIAESALGRGLASQGLVADARRALAASIERAPSIDAFQTLTTIELQTDHYSAAQRWADHGRALLGEQSSADRYHRAKLERLTGDALRRAGRPQDAAARYLDGLRAWASLGETKDLPPAIAAERALDYGKTMWWLGRLAFGSDPLAAQNVARSIDSVLDAVELDPTEPAIALGAVAFLIEADRFDDAVDAFHRALGANLSDDTKVYLALWVAAEARRRGAPLDRLAADYLGTRHGDTWHEQLARTATGRLEFTAVQAAATTGPRRADLAFYGAVLGFHPLAGTPAGRRGLLDQAVAAQVVLDPTYDLARYFLGATSPATP